MPRPSLCQSRAKPRDLRCALRPSRIFRYKPQYPNRSVIPTEAKRSGGTCCSIHPLTTLTESTTLPFVIPSEAEGSALRPSALPNSPLQPPTSKQNCHPGRSEWRDLLFPSIHFPGAQWKHHPPLCHPERSRGICGAPSGLREFSITDPNIQTEVSSVHPLPRRSMEAPPTPLSSRGTEAERPAVSLPL